MFIGKVSKQFFVLKPDRQFYDVEADQLPDAVRERLVKMNEEYVATQAYLAQVYNLLRQTGAADVTNVEVPPCLSEAASKPKSTSTSRKRKSSSSTKKKATNSGSQSTGDTSA